MLRALALVAALALLPGASFADTPASPELQALRRGTITVLHGPADAGFAREVAERAVDRAARIRRDFGLSREVEVTLLLLAPAVPAPEREAWERTLPPWLAGRADARGAFIVLRVEPGRTARALEPLIAHELTHVILKADFPRAPGWPLWFQEGLAMRSAGTEGLEQFGALGPASLLGRTLPLDSLRFHFPHTAGDARLAYAESYSFLTFLIGDLGPARFGRLMTELREVPFDEAFARVYGTSPADLEREWLRWATRRYAWVPLVTGGTAVSLLWVALFFAALAVRRRKDRALRERWAHEDPEEEHPWGTWENRP